MREIVHLQAGQCGNQIGAKVSERALEPSLRFWLTAYPPFHSSGKSSLTSMASTRPAPTMATLTFSWSASTSTTTRPRVASTCHVPC